MIFTGGIGENSSSVRARVCKGLGFLGIAIDKEKNKTLKGPADISDAAASVRVYLVPTNEERMIARETVELLAKD